MISRDSKSKGFTLIELLVVISIISLLSTVILGSVRTAQVRARNVKRLQDIRQLIIAFNLGLTNTNIFPDSDGGAYICISTVCTGEPNGSWENFNSANIIFLGVDNFFTPYMAKPTDPTDTTRPVSGYGYYRDPSNVSYIIFDIEPGGSCGFATMSNLQPTYTECTYTFG